MDGFEGMHCWIPRRLLGPISDPNSWSEEEVENRPEREFDIPIEEALSEHASALREAGLLRWIDPAAEVVGVALDLRRLDRGKLAALLAPHTGQLDFVDYQIIEMLKHLKPAELEEPEIRGLWEHLVDESANTPDEAD